MKIFDSSSPEWKEFHDAVSEFELQGDLAPLAKYLTSDKPLDSIMKHALARIISGEHGKFQRFVLRIADEGFPPDLEEEERPYREAAEKIWLMVMCEHWKKDAAILHVRKETGLGANPLRAALKRVEEEFECELRILRGPTAKKKRGDK